MSRFSARSVVASLAAAAALVSVAPAASAQFGSAGGAAQAGITAGNISAQSAPAAAPAQQYAAAIPATAMLQQMLDATNAYRAANNVPPVRYNGQLAAIAQTWSERQATEDRMYHNPDLRTLNPAGWTMFGENVLQNWDDATAQQLIQQWIDSPPHRAAMLNPAYTDLGLGWAVKADGKVFATQNYARF